MKRKLLAMALIVAFSVATFAGCGGGGGDTSSAAAGGGGGGGDLNFGFLNQIDTWPAYSAIQDGTAEKYGLSGLDTQKNMQLFDSGMPMVEAMISGAWQIGDAGSVPVLMAALRYDAEVVGIASNESPANAIVAREDNPALKVTNPKFENAKGDAASVKGKTILVATVSSAHFVVDQWLKSMDLTDKDVTIKNLEQPQAIKAFESGEGDFLALWSPELYQAYGKGWKDVATGKDVNANTLMLYFAPKDWAKDNKDTIARFLAMTSTKVEEYNSKGEELVPDLQKFFQDFGAMKFSEEETKLDIERHELYTVDQQLELISSGDVEKWMIDIGDFFVRQGKFTEDELAQLKEKHFNITDEYLKAAKDVSPSK